MNNPVATAHIETVNPTTATPPPSLSNSMESGAGSELTPNVNLPAPSTVTDFSGTMTSIRTSKKFINVRRLTALPSQLKLEPHVRQEILDDISTRSDTPLSPTPSQSTCLSRTCNSHSSTSPPPSPSFDYIDFQRHDPSLRDGWLLENKFRKEDLMRRENKWRTVDRHSGASTQLVVFQCKCGIPPKAPSAVFGKMGRHMGGVRTYPYLSCKAFVHMTCDSQGLPLVVRGFFSHTHACAKTTTLSPLRFNIDPFFENLAVSQLERNQPMRVILAENARRVRELSHDRVKEMTDNGTRALLCRSDVRNLRRALLRKRPELKRVHGEGSKNREFGQSKLGKVIGGGVTKNRKSARSAFVGEDDEDDSSSDEDGDRFCRHSSSTPATTNAEFESVITAGVTQKSGAPPMTFQDRFGADTAQIRQLAPPSVPAHSSGSPPHAPISPPHSSPTHFHDHHRVASWEGYYPLPPRSFHSQIHDHQVTAWEGYYSPPSYGWYSSHHYNGYAMPYPHQQHHRHHQEWYGRSNSVHYPTPPFSPSYYSRLPQEPLGRARAESLNVRNWKEVVMM